MPFKNEYVNYYSGSTSTTGQNILDNYDETKKLFESNELDFSNTVIDTSTGKPNLNGRIILKNMSETKKLLEEHSIPVKKCYYDSSTGCLNRSGNKALDEAKENALSFKGSTDDQQFAPADPDDADIPVMQDDNSIPIHRMSPEERYFRAPFKKDYDFTFSKEEKLALKEIDKMDMHLDPVLQEIHDAPPLNTVEGLMTSIFGEIPEGVNFDWDLWSIIDDAIDEILDIGDWLV